MILTMRLGDKTVTAGCPPNSLIFDGTDWGPPKVGGYATLVYKQPTLAGMPVYPVNEVQVPGGFRVDSRYQCLILSVDNAVGGQSPIINVPDPLGGACLCLVCNLGTQLLNVKVTQL
jgi:hypothetical protein